jgi:hypothetical protein
MVTHLLRKGEGLSTAFCRPRQGHRATAPRFAVTPGLPRTGWTALGRRVFDANRSGVPYQSDLGSLAHSGTPWRRGRAGRHIPCDESIRHPSFKRVASRVCGQKWTLE